MSEDGTTYAIRYRRRAQTDAQEAVVRLAELTDSDHAAAWYSALQDALATLATFPERAPIADERRFFRDDVRVLLYRHTPGSATYRISTPLSSRKKMRPLSMSFISAMALVSR